MGGITDAELAARLAEKVSPASDVVRKILRVLLFRLVRKTGWVPQILHAFEGVGPCYKAFLNGFVVRCWIDDGRGRGTVGFDGDLKIEDFPNWHREVEISFQCPPHIFQDERIVELMRENGLDGVLTSERIIGK